MSPTLLGGTGASPGTATGTSPARTDSGGSRDRRDFDALLKGDTGRTPTARKSTASDTPKAKDTPSSSPQDTSTRPASKRPKDSANTAAAPPADASATAGETSADTDTDTTATADAAPWPPLGLAGLALTGLTPPPADPQTVATLPATTTADPALTPDALLGGTPTTPAPTAPALPAAAAASTAATASTDGAIALPLDAEVSDDIALPKALADALNAGNADADAPPTPFLHALQTAADLKANAASAPFAGSPTATPHVGGEDFDDAMSARIGWLADQKIGHATIKVTPHDLGLIEVRLQMDGDKVHASFTSAHADVRHALESSLPRLREMLNDQGFQLGNADVGHQQTAQDGKPGSDSSARGGRGGDAEPTLTETTISPAQLMRQRGLVDAYA